MKIVAITGSGISSGSDIKTYREDPQWDSYAQGMAHFSRYGNYLPKLWEHWTQMARTIETAIPNPAHYALAERGTAIITQNVDGLHVRAGSENVIELHGNMYSMRCLRCKKTMPCDTSTTSPDCTYCGSSRMRTNSVLFGERLLTRNVTEAQKLVMDADVVLVIGTSGVVYPARALVDLAIEHTEYKTRTTILFDRVPWPDLPDFTEVIIGPAEETLPRYLNAL
ncbi:MAG: NAD-dependent deacylase [Enterococcus sp.]|nr:NAD-dependent deacylase [Enterococcus sp.]